MAANRDISYEILKARMDRAGMDIPKAQADYWMQRLEAAEQNLADKGIYLEDTLQDNTLLADYAAFNLQNRDKGTGEPEWLRLEIRERWLAQPRRDQS